MGKSEKTSYFINRELSWLKFNERVLDEAVDINTPVLEKLKFISIFCSNLDEFFMIRVGSLFDQSLLSTFQNDNKTGLTPSEQLELIYENIRQLLKKKKSVYHTVIGQLSQNNIRILNLNLIDKNEKDFLTEYFRENILPFLSPSIIKLRIFEMLKIMLKDNTKARKMLPNGDYIYVVNDEEKINSQTYFFEQSLKKAKDFAIIQAKRENENSISKKTGLGNIFRLGANFISESFYRIVNKKE